MGACGPAVLTFPDDVVTQTFPLVNRVEPASGAPGTTITIYGFGFSAAPPLNVVTVGGSSSVATDYQLLTNPTSDEIEQLTATVPNDAATGQSSVLVVVHENASNADVLFEVTP